MAASLYETHAGNGVRLSEAHSCIYERYPVAGLGPATHVLVAHIQRRGCPGHAWQGALEGSITEEPLMDEPIKLEIFTDYV